MNRRLDQHEKSTDFLFMNFTHEDDDRRRALAEYLGVSDSALIRSLPPWKRTRLRAEGKLPPLTPRGELRKFAGQRFAGKFVMRKIRVAPDEKEGFLALSQYLKLPYNEMISQLAEERRTEIREGGGNPPVRPRAKKNEAR